MKRYNSEENDPYLLRHNLLGIQTYEQLEEAEALVFSIRAAELEQRGFHFPFTKEGFKSLHQHLFQDLYSFAGEFRDVQLMKGGTRFCQVEHLDLYSADLFCKLGKEPGWTTLEEAADRLAFFKSELNMLHPFREGNGRTTRIFIHAYARSKGLEWAYETIPRDVYMEAMIESVIKSDSLKALFLKTLDFL